MNPSVEASHAATPLRGLTAFVPIIQLLDHPRVPSSPEKYMVILIQVLYRHPLFILKAHLLEYFILFVEEHSFLNLQIKFLYSFDIIRDVLRLYRTHR